MTKSWQQSMLLLSLYFLYVFLQVLLATNSVSSKRLVRCHDDESLALLQFMQSFSIDESASEDRYAYAKVASWKQNGSGNGTIDDCCSWDGVACSAVTGRVIGLDLSSSFLHGAINSSSSLFYLVHLQSLDLSRNDFMLSHIPSGISSLSQLTRLNLSYSGFSGQIPKEISQLTLLASLDLSKNPLLKLQSLSFEHLIQSLQMLKGLHLSYVNISSAVPQSLANLTSLRHLDLMDCGLTGDFPSGIFNLREIQTLSVRFNEKLAGSLPEFHLASRLERLQIEGTSFSGRLPDSIGNLKSLVMLNLYNSYFSESLPASLGNLTELTYIDLGGNEFKGHVPSLASLSELWGLSLGGIEFDDGILPSWFGKLTKLTLIDLSNTNLYGKMPSFLSNLTQLTYLDLGSNHINGPIPSFLSNLTQLTNLDLQSNHINGPIPSFLSNLTQLTYLDLQSNHINGPIPSWLMNLTQLTLLDFSQNNLSGIVEADEFVNLKELHYLQLSYNDITFMDLKNYTNAILPQFQVLGLSSCNLKVLPNLLRSQNELLFLQLSKNNIRGKIPEWFLNCSKETLEMLDLSENLLTGFEKHPHELLWDSVHFLDLGNNMLQGSLPVPPPNTAYYRITQNSLTGEIPVLICQVSSIRALDLSHNNMTGIIPPCLGNKITSLAILMLKGNTFRGTIPNSFLKESKLELIDISENQMEGQLPRSLANCSMLQFVNFADNSVDDYFPFWLGILSYLRILILRSNKFHGEIKSSLPINSDQFPKLRILDLSHNSFEGYLPQDYMIWSWPLMKIIDYNASYLGEFTEIHLYNGATSATDIDFSISITNRGVKREYVKVWSVFTVLDLSSNRLVGEISSAIGQLQGLQLLNLSNNHLTGHIALSFANLTNLESLDLSRNSLSGAIPLQFAQLTSLAFLNVSQNNLVGPIPQGNQMLTFENTSYEGNMGLCGEPLSNKCGNTHEPWVNAPRSEEDDESLFPTHALGWIIVSLGLASGLIVGLVFGNYLTDRHCVWFARKFGLFI